MGFTECRTKDTFKGALTIKGKRPWAVSDDAGGQKRIKPWLHIF